MRRPTPATIIASAALFFSLAGTGIAAQHYLITSLSQIAPKVRQELRGAQGPQGPRGPQGVPGPTGQQGPQGVPGLQGVAGQSYTTPGAGISVTCNGDGTATVSVAQQAVASFADASCYPLP